jgi:hypothetical protein
MLKKGVNRMGRQRCKTHTGETTRTNGQFSAPQNDSGDLTTHFVTLGGKTPFCAENPQESCPSPEYLILQKGVNRVGRQPNDTHTGETTSINGQLSAPQIEFGDLATHITTLGGNIPCCTKNLRESSPNAEY